MESAVRKPRSLHRIAWRTAACLLLGVPAAWAQGAPEPVLPSVIAGIDAGRFADTEARIARALADPATTAEQRDALSFQRERMRRIRLDFTLDEVAAQAQVRRQIPDLTVAEFQRWDAQGKLEHLDIDGTRWWFKRAPSNLFRISEQARARRAPGVPVPQDGPYEHLHPHHHDVIAAAHPRSDTPCVSAPCPNAATRRVTVTQSLTVKPDAVPAGEKIRAWIPYPRAIPGQQDDIEFLGSTPANAQPAPESTLQRTAYLERTAVAGKPTTFELRYALTVHARHTDIDTAQVTPTPADPALQSYLAEQPPHIVFTDALRDVSRHIVGTETNPARIANRLFDYVDRIPWAGAREYSTLSNISSYALNAGHADCGQQTLLLITLLRMNGIPARWQSGMVYSDDAVGYNNLHDWGALYLAPYGWVPMDVTTGRLNSDQPALRDFYFGGLDAYRIAFNDGQGQPLVPAKQYPRSDTVDNQRGEVEWAGGNLYFNQWNYQFETHIQ